MNRKQRNARKMARRRGECIAPVVLVDTQANTNMDAFCLMAAMYEQICNAPDYHPPVKIVSFREWKDLTSQERP